MCARTLAILAVAALLIPVGFAAAQVEGLRPYPGPLPGAEPDGVSVILVRDRLTGAPLGGVVVKRYLEIIDPRVGLAPFKGEAVTDAFGLVAMPVEEGSPDSHWVFEKPGHSVAEEYGTLCDPIVELRPGRALHGRVLDARGRPAGAVPVELFLGCGHSPAVRRATTDATGRFTFRDVTPYFGTLWIPAPHLAAHNVNGPAGVAKDRPFIVHTRPGIVLKGVVVDEAGKPLANMAVRSSQESRGPIATTGPDGRFELVGYDPDEGLRLCGPDKREVWVHDGSFSLARPARLVYPPPDDGENPEADTIPIVVRVIDGASGKPAPDAIVHLHDPKHGSIRRFDLSDCDRLEARPGDYLLKVGDPDSRLFSPPMAITVAEKPGPHLQLVARSRPCLVVDAPSFPDHGDAHLELIVGPRVVLLPRERDEPTYLPAEARAMLRAEADGLVRHFPVGPAENGKRHVTVTWPAMKRVECGFGRTYDLTLRHTASRHEKGAALVTHASGRVRLVVRDRNLGEQEIPIEIPDQPGAVTRLPDGVLRAPGTLRVTLPDGKPLADESLRLDGEHWRLDDNGRLVAWDVQAGAAIRVARTGFVTLRRTLVGAGPHELRWGAGHLDLAVPGLDGFTAYVDGELYHAEKTDRLSLAGLDAGPHTVILAAEGRESRIFRVSLAEGESRAVSIALPKKP